MGAFFMNILLTGSTGFVGKALMGVLSLQHEVVTLGRKKADIIADLSKETPKLSGRIDRVIHNAGLAHILNKDIPGYDKNMYDCNYSGTLRVLRALEELEFPPAEFVLISTVAVYGLSSGFNISENSPLLATDSYGKSKILAERAALEWGLKNNVSIIILRLPLVVGENPPGNLGQMIKAIRSYKYFSIGNGEARKSMVLVSDLASLLNRSTLPSGIFNLTDGFHPSFRELEVAIKRRHNVRFVLKVPVFVAKTLMYIGEFLQHYKVSRFPFNKVVFEKLTTSLTFSDEKAREQLGWVSHKVIDYYSYD
jgi:nucleoside-diphosphate-sugar epimerase